MLCVMFGWISPSGSGDFEISSMYFRHFVNISPWIMVWLFIWTNLNPPHPRIVPSFVEIGLLVLKKKIFKYFNVCSLFRDYLPLEKNGARHFNNLESSLPKDALYQVWLKLAQWFLRRRWKCEKFTDGRTDRQTTDDRWSEKLRWAKNETKL